jgi:hypothetical protein
MLGPDCYAVAIAVVLYVLTLIGSSSADPEGHTLIFTSEAGWLSTATTFGACSNREEEKLTQL